MASSSFKAVIEGFFQRQGGWPRLKGGLAVYYWPRVAGSEITAKVAAIRFYDGFLYLQTDNAALAHQISLLNLDIVKKYRKILGPNIVKGVKIKIGPVQLHDGNNSKNEPEVILNSKETAMIEKCRQMIPEPDLAVKFAELMAKHYIVKRQIEATGGKRCRACNIIIESYFEYCPCCERQTKEEKEAYHKFIKKSMSIQC
jgi:hypothetical protein